MGVQISMRAAGAFVTDGLATVCPDIFEALYNNCNGAVGGTADLTLNDSQGQQTGFVEADFSASDPGATCPPPSDTAFCGTSTGN